MEISDSVIEIEPTVNTNTPTPLLSRTEELDNLNWRWRVWNALQRDNWDAIKKTLDKLPEGLNGTEYYWVEQRKASPIHYVARYGSYLPAKLLLSKFPAMLNMVDHNEDTPIQTALRYNKTEMACYMLKLGVTHVKDLLEFELTFKMDLEYALKNGKYDFAYILIQQCPKLALDESIWKWLIEECDDLPCRSRLNMLQSYIYPRIHMDDEIVLESLTREWEKANNRIRLENENLSVEAPVVEEHGRSSDKENRDLASSSNDKSNTKVAPFKSVRTLKLKHHQARKFVKRLCFETKIFLDEDCRNFIRLVFWLAVHNGVSDIVEIILNIYRHAIEYKDDDGNNVLQYAVLHRDGKTFHVVDENIKYRNFDITSSVDDKGNNLLHLVAKKARRNRLGTGSAKVLQLQREFQWYKEMEKVLPSYLKFKKNGENQVPLEVFDEEHKDMLKSESEWLTSMSNSCMVAGSLIAAVVFAAAITLPGGNNDGDGLPKFSKIWAFKVFAFSDAIALVSSLTSVMTFLSIFITRYSVESFQYDLPRRLLIGLISLFLSVTFLMILFVATVYLFYADSDKWIMYLTVVVASVPVWFPLHLQLPSMLNIIKSTYGHNIYKDDNVTILDKQ